MNGNFTPLDLRNVYNHRLFYEQVPNSKNYGLDQTCFLLKENNIRESMDINEVPFLFKFGGCDTVVCEGQRLSIKGEFDLVHFIGFFYWGENFETYYVVTKTCQSIPYKICFPDWSRKIVEKPEPYQLACGYKNILPGLTLHSNGKEKRELNIFHYISDLSGRKQLSEIILPDYFLLHILAITCEKREHL